MVRDIWTLTKTTTVKTPHERIQHFWEKENESWEFSDFGEARAAFRRVARECATSRGNVFDGDGNIRNLQELFDNLKENFEDQRRNPRPTYHWGNMLLRGAPEVALMAGDFESARAMPAALRSWLLDMDVYDKNPLPEFRWTDWGFGIVSKPKSLAMGVLDGCGRFEFYDAQVYTDAFRMDDPGRSYEFSVRTYFDVYDYEAGSLRIRLVPGASDGLGRFPWPEDEGVDWSFPEGASPCLAGEIDANFSISVGARPKASFGKDERALLYEGYEGFLDDIVALTKKRGLAVDRDGNKTVFRDISCYRAKEGGPWFRIRIQARFDDDSRGREDAPIWVGRSLFEDYAEALREIGWLIDEYMSRNISRTEKAWEFQQRMAGDR